MKASELRIGNWIEAKTTPINWEKCKITKDDFKMIRNDDDSIRGIPLTEGWLLKFGFEKDDRFDTQYRIDGHRFTSLNILITNNFFSPILRRDSQHEVFELYGIKYVHQLQNLYFALTGEELQITQTQNP